MSTFFSILGLSGLGIGCCMWGILLNDEEDTEDSNYIAVTGGFVNLISIIALVMAAAFWE